MSDIFRKTVAGGLAVMIFLMSSLTCTAFAAGDEPGVSGNSGTFTNGTAYNDVMETAKDHSEESAGMSQDDYLSSSTLDYFIATANLMAQSNTYRLALENTYGTGAPVERTVYNNADLWTTATSDIATNSGAYNVTQSGGTTVYQNSQSYWNTLDLLKYTVSESEYEILQRATSISELYDLYRRIAETHGAGGQYYWTDTENGGNDTADAVMPKIGDICYFEITATLGSMSMEGSYEQRIRRETSNGTTILQEPKVYANPSIGSSYTIVPGSSVSIVYIGTVLGFDERGVHAVCGTADLSGVGGIQDSYVEMRDSSGTVVSRTDATYGPDGTISLVVEATPSWNLTMTAKFVPGILDYSKILENMKGSYDDQGNLLRRADGSVVRIDDPDFPQIIAKLMGKPEDSYDVKARVGAARMQYCAMYMTTILGYSDSFAEAILRVMSVETGCSFNPNQLQQGGGPGTGLCQWENSPGGRWPQLVSWCSDNGYDQFSLEGQLQFMNHELTTRSAFKEVFMTGMLSDNVEDAVSTFVKNYEICANQGGEIAQALGLWDEKAGYKDTHLQYVRAAIGALFGTGEFVNTGSEHENENINDETGRPNLPGECKKLKGYRSLYDFYVDVFKSLGIDAPVTEATIRIAIELSNEAAMYDPEITVISNINVMRESDTLYIPPREELAKTLGIS